MTYFGFTLLVTLAFALMFSCILVSASTRPRTMDDNLVVDLVFTGHFKPTGMAFLDMNNILVLDRDGGKVYIVTKGKLNPAPALDVNVATVGYRGMLGISLMKTGSNGTIVFLYYTESTQADGTDELENGGMTPLGNRVYRYELIDGKLTNPKLILDLPAEPGPRHMGGVIVTGPDNYLYITVGDLDGTFKTGFQTLAQNYQNGSIPDGRSGIIRVSSDGSPVANGILGESNPLNVYFAYGLRNSFGLDFDPITGNLWDTENGPHYGDEINLVQPGFNSGWATVQGFWRPNQDEMGNLFVDPDILVTFDGKGNYSKPEFVWVPPVAPTAIKFLNSDKLGLKYANDIFVGDANYGNIYHFDLNKQRNDLQLNSPLTDRIADTMTETDDIIFANGFGRITDIEVGIDGYIYVLSSEDDGTTLYRIRSK